MCLRKQWLVLFSDYLIYTKTVQATGIHHRVKFNFVCTNTASLYYITHLIHTSGFNNTKDRQSNFSTEMHFDLMNQFHKLQNAPVHIPQYSIRKQNAHISALNGALYDNICILGFMNEVNCTNTCNHCLKKKFQGKMLTTYYVKWNIYIYIIFIRIKYNDKVLRKRMR